jgi:trehalose 6-phosphate synthase
VDRTEPSKNIVRGFESFGQLLEQHPEHCGNVIFIALLMPSRLDVDEYRDYHDKIMAAAGWVNSKYGSSEWEPVRILLGEDYDRAIGAMQLYDVLLVNSIADGMNLVAKEGPIVNQRDGVLVLSESTGAYQQLAEGAIVISPCDIQSTANAMHRALIMSKEERKTRASLLRRKVEGNDLHEWFWDQVKEASKCGCLQKTRPEEQK